MTVADLIEWLRDLDPTGERDIRVPDGDDVQILDVEDGPLILVHDAEAALDESPGHAC